MQLKTMGLLHDIHTAAEFIVGDTSGATLESFMQNRQLRQTVERNFGIIGEAMNRLARHDSSVVAQISDYEEIIAVRNFHIHGHDVNNDRHVWECIQRYLPVLRAEVKVLLHTRQS